MKSKSRRAARLMTNSNRLTIANEVFQQGDIVEIMVALEKKKAPLQTEGKLHCFLEIFFFLWMTSGARMLPNMPAVKNKCDTEVTTREFQWVGGHHAARDWISTKLVNLPLGSDFL